MELLIALFLLAFVLFFLALFAGLAFFFIKKRMKQNEVTAAGWKDSAQKLGLTIREDRKKAFHLMDGVYKNIPVEVGIAYRMMGEISYFYTYCRVPFNPPLGLGLKLENYLLTSGRVKDMLGIQKTIVTGNQEFDSKFSVTAADPQKVQAILTRQFADGENPAAKIVKSLGALETILIDDASFYTEIRKSLYGEQHLRQFLDWSVYAAGGIDAARR